MRVTVADARLADDPKEGWPHSSLSAMRALLDTISIGETVMVTGIIDNEGERLPMSRVSMFTSQVKGKRRFRTWTADKDGKNVAYIKRLR